MATLGTHLSHCNFGEHVGCCKYGDAEDCPALSDEWKWFGANLQRADKVLNARHEAAIALGELRQYVEAFTPFSKIEQTKALFDAVRTALYRMDAKPQEPAVYQMRFTADRNVKSSWLDCSKEMYERGMEAGKKYSNGFEFRVLYDRP